MRQHDAGDDDRDRQRDQPDHQLRNRAISPERASRHVRMLLRVRASAKASYTRPMADRDEILAFAAELLELDAYPDYGPMGMQVAGAHEVERIACGVSASLELFDQAAKAGAQLVLVHHGLLWDRDSRVIDGALRRRLRALLDSDITL